MRSKKKKKKFKKNVWGVGITRGPGPPKAICERKGLFHFIV